MLGLMWNGVYTGMAEYIDRKKLMDDISKYSIENYAGLIRNVVMKQPAADVLQWIPVAEKLPEQEGYYLCCIEGDLRIVFFDKYENAFGYDRTVFDPEIIGFTESEFTPYNVTHWMPFPELPKEGWQ